MKTSLKLFALGMILAGFGVNASAQVSDVATASATIIAPIAIDNTQVMNFGNIAVSTAPGKVYLVPGGTRTADGGVTLPTSLPGTILPALFTVTGAPNFTYAITLPGSVTLTNTTGTGSETMTANNFISTPDGIGTLTSGTSTLAVGATLNVGGSQVAGAYVSGTAFTVTVNYN